MRQFPAMLDFFYTILIAPLEYWMHAVLCWGYERLHVWGWAIVVMSLVVNFVILPIYIKAESWQEEERAIRKRFEAKEAMIKTVFKGQERFAMISTMQRQAGYTPLLTLRSSIGFFLQIPFFFAAYHFLSHFAPFSGVSFLGLTDLSKPDDLVRKLVDQRYADPYDGDQSLFCARLHAQSFSQGQDSALWYGGCFSCFSL